MADVLVEEALGLLDLDVAGGVGVHEGAAVEDDQVAVVHGGRFPSLRLASIS
jgi:hypothetical protein